MRYKQEGACIYQTEIIARIQQDNIRWSEERSEEGRGKTAAEKGRRRIVNANGKRKMEECKRREEIEVSDTLRTHE